jgi:hypothetical protein
LRTYWRAAASISSTVASGFKPRRVVILRHMACSLRLSGAVVPLKPGGSAVVRRPPLATVSGAGPIM